jgi:hypothetical protein
MAENARKGSEAMTFTKVTNAWTQALYDRIYTTTGLGADCVVLAHANDDIHQGNLNTQLSNINGGGISGMHQDSPHSTGFAANARLFHTSMGNAGAQHSATIFFAVYAVASNYNGGNDPYSCKVTYLGSQHAFRAKYDDPAFNAAHPTGVLVSPSTLQFLSATPATVTTHGHQQVQQANLKLIIVIAGIGYHTAGHSYAMPVRNSNYIISNTVVLGH